MPSQRKRIGFLPSAEVQEIIDKICQENQLSQSKVTGILVEEALSYRGVLKFNLNEESLKSLQNYNNFFLNKNYISPKEEYYENQNINLGESYIKDEARMINDFIEFKIFKNIITQRMNSDKSVTL